jgi:hypothetical protein
MLRTPRLGDSAPIVLPRPPAVPVTAQGFTMCSVEPLNPSQQWVYQKAFENAQAVVQPSLPERDLLGVWN